MPTPTPYVSPFGLDVEPFDSAEDAVVWAWAFRPGATSGAYGHWYLAESRSTSRPCEPTDVLIVIDRMIEQYSLDAEEISLIRHLGRHGPARLHAEHPKWPLLLERLTFHLQAKGIVKRPGPAPQGYG
jgi:hypothetical protein